MRLGARLGPLGVPFQRLHLRNVHLLEELRDAPFADGVGLGFLQGARIPLPDVALMLSAGRLVGWRKPHGPCLGRVFQIAGPRRPLSLAWIYHRGDPDNLSLEVAGP